MFSLRTSSRNTISPVDRTGVSGKKSLVQEVPELKKLVKPASWLQKTFKLNQVSPCDNCDEPLVISKKRIEDQQILCEQSPLGSSIERFKALKYLFNNNQNNIKTDFFKGIDVLDKTKSTFEEIRSYTTDLKKIREALEVKLVDAKPNNPITSILFEPEVAEKKITRIFKKFSFNKLAILANKYEQTRRSLKSQFMSSLRLNSTTFAETTNENSKLLDVVTTDIVDELKKHITEHSNAFNVLINEISNKIELGKEIALAYQDLFDDPNSCISEHFSYNKKAEKASIDMNARIKKLEIIKDNLIQRYVEFYERDASDICKLCQDTLKINIDFNLRKVLDNLKPSDNNQIASGSKISKSPQVSPAEDATVACTEPQINKTNTLKTLLKSIEPFSRLIKSVRSKAIELDEKENENNKLIDLARLKDANLKEKSGSNSILPNIKAEPTDEVREINAVKKLIETKAKNIQKFFGELNKEISSFPAREELRLSPTPDFNKKIIAMSTGFNKPSCDRVVNEMKILTDRVRETYDSKLRYPTLQDIKRRFVYKPIKKVKNSIFVQLQKLLTSKKELKRKNIEKERAIKAKAKFDNDTSNGMFLHLNRIHLAKNPGLDSYQTLIFSLLHLSTGYYKFGDSEHNDPILNDLQKELQNRIIYMLKIQYPEFREHSFSENFNDDIYVEAIAEIVSAMFDIKIHPIFFSKNSKAEFISPAYPDLNDKTLVPIFFDQNKRTFSAIYYNDKAEKIAES